MDYDPLWHPNVECFARNLQKPDSAREVRRFAEQMYDNFTRRRLVDAQFWQRLEAFRAEEDDPSARHNFDPLFIDSNIVEIRALLLYVRPETGEILRHYEKEFLLIAMRTKPWRHALLHVQPPPTLDLC